MVMVRGIYSGEELRASFSREYVVGRLRGGLGSARVAASQVVGRMTRGNFRSLAPSTSVF